MRIQQWMPEGNLASACQAFEGQDCSQQPCSGIPLAKHEQTSKIPRRRLVVSDSHRSLHYSAAHPRPAFQGCIISAAVLHCVVICWGRSPCLASLPPVGSGSQVSSSFSVSVGGKGPYRVQGALCKFNEAGGGCLQPGCWRLPLLALRIQESRSYSGHCFSQHPLPFVLAETPNWLFSAPL